MKININLPSSIRYPSLAAIPFQLGAVSVSTLQSTWTLYEDNTKIPCHVEVVNQWVEDESVKWIHVYAIFEGGKNYEFKQGIPLSDNIGTFSWIAPQWQVEVIEEVDNMRYYWKESLSNAVNFPEITQIGYSNFDKFGSVISNSNSENTVFNEINNAFLKITRFEGWLNPDVGFLPSNNKQYKFILRQIKYANHDLVKYSLSVVFATEMTNKKIVSIGLDLNLNDSSVVSNFSAFKNGQLSSINSSSNSNLTICQRKINQAEIDNVVPFEDNVKYDGYFSNGSQAFLVRDFWQKYPHAVNFYNFGGKRIKYYQWFGNKMQDSFTTTDITATNNLHKLLHWHNGVVLENNSYDNWATAFYSQQPEKVNLKSGEKFAYLDDNVVPSQIHIDMQGMTIHDDFAVLNNTTVGTNQSAWNTIWQSNPVGYCNGEYIAATNIYDMAAKGLDYPKIETFIEEATLSFTDPKRYETYGRFMYGESQRTHNIAEERPDLYRLGLALYYNAGESNWRLWLRGGNENKTIETDSTRELLQHARRGSEHYRNCLFVAYDELKGNLPARTQPKIQYHNPAATWARGLWWGADYTQMGGDGDWSMITGRDTDPDNFLLSWIIDGNRHHKDAYEFLVFNYVQQNSN